MGACVSISQGDGVILSCIYIYKIAVLALLSSYQADKLLGSRSDSDSDVNSISRHNTFISRQIARFRQLLQVAGQLRGMNWTAFGYYKLQELIGTLKDRLLLLHRWKEV